MRRSKAKTKRLARPHCDDCGGRGYVPSLGTIERNGRTYPEGNVVCKCRVPVVEAQPAAPAGLDAQSRAAGERLD